MRNLSEFLTEGVYDTPRSITKLYVQPTWLEFRYNGMAVNVDLFDLPDTIFPITKKSLKNAIEEIEKLIVDDAGEDVLNAPNWAETMSEITRQIEALFINTNNKITEVAIDENEVILACDGKAVSFSIVRCVKEPFPSEEAAIAFVERQLKPFKGARNYKKIFGKIMLVMDDNHYWVSDED